MKQKITVEIEAEYGSDFQTELRTETLISLLQIWRGQVKYGHKKNTVIVKFNGNPIQDIPTRYCTQTSNVW